MVDEMLSNTKKYFIKLNHNSFKKRITDCLDLQYATCYVPYKYKLVNIVACVGLLLLFALLVTHDLLLFCINYFDFVTLHYKCCMDVFKIKSLSPISHS